MSQKQKTKDQNNSSQIHANTDVDKATPAEWGRAEAGYCSCNVLVVDKLCVEHMPLGCELISQGWVGPWGVNM